MAVIIKNNGDDPWVLKDTSPKITIPSAGQLDLELHLSLAAIAASDQLLADVNNDALSLTVNDGSKDLTVAAAIRHIFQRPSPGPQTSDGKPIQRSSAYALGTRLYIAGCGDHRSNGVGKGPRFQLQHGASGFSEWYDFQFNDWVELGGGGMWYKDAVFGDYVAFRLYAPATEIVPNAGAGNCNVHASGILIPASGNGSHDVDLETADKFVPLITSGGYWNWNYPDTGLGSCEPAPNGDGNCNLVPAVYPIHTYVADVGILGDGYLNVTFPGVDPTRFIPQWKMSTRLYNVDGAHTVQIVWEVEVARMNGAVVYT